MTCYSVYALLDNGSVLEETFAYYRDARRFADDLDDRTDVAYLWLKSFEV